MEGSADAATRVAPAEMGLEVLREHLSRMTQYEECEGGAGEALSPVLTEETENYRV